MTTDLIPDDFKNAFKNKEEIKQKMHRNGKNHKPSIEKLYILILNIVGK